MFQFFLNRIDVSELVVLLRQIRLQRSDLTFETSGSVGFGRLDLVKQFVFFFELLVSRFDLVFQVVVLCAEIAKLLLQTSFGGIEFVQLFVFFAKV